MTFTVHETSYGVRIVDSETLEEIAVETKDIRGLIVNLSGYIPMDINYNTILYGTVEGVVNHTYSPRCPPGCYGQLEGCYYKKKG
jgi:hypothetical protein